MYFFFFSFSFFLRFFFFFFYQKIHYCCRRAKKCLFSEKGYITLTKTYIYANFHMIITTKLYKMKKLKLLSSRYTSILCQISDMNSSKKSRHFYCILAKFIYIYIIFFFFFRRGDNIFYYRNFSESHKFDE